MKTYEVVCRGKNGMIESISAKLRYALRFTETEKFMGDTVYEYSFSEDRGTVMVCMLVRCCSDGEAIRKGKLFCGVHHNLN